MIQLRQLALPAYLFLCLALGGSPQGIWANMVLQLLAVGLLVWTVLSRWAEGATSASKLLMALICAVLVLFVLQLLPLPPNIWSDLPGREPIGRGYSSLGLELPWLPISITPYATLTTALTLLPPLAVLLVAIRIPQNESWLAGALLIGAFAGVLLGAMQVTSGSPLQSPWYFYRVTNYGAVGFFANSNHMGTLLLVSIPFAMALVATARSQQRKPGASGFLAAAGLLVILVGIGLNRSMTALALAAPVLLLSAMLLPTGWKLRRFALPAGAILLVACLAFLTSSPMRAELAGQNLSSFESRSIFWNSTVDVIGRTFPVGTGIGSFASVYSLSEDPAAVGRTFVNHAHNDYLEILLEAGLPGLILIAAFLCWWVVAAFDAWRSPLASEFGQAATIASATILAHSLVDYPLRTTAISSVFALCLGLMAVRQVRPVDEPSALRATRHISIG